MNTRLQSLSTAQLEMRAAMPTNNTMKAAAMRELELRKKLKVKKA